jgi:hypothetical protein
VKRYAAIAAIAMLIAGQVVLPMVARIAHERSLQASGMRYAVYDHEYFIFGISVPPETLVPWSACLATPFAFVASLALYVAVRNARFNRARQTFTIN